LTDEYGSVVDILVLKRTPTTIVIITFLP